MVYHKGVMYHTTCSQILIAQFYLGQFGLLYGSCKKNKTTPAAHKLASCCDVGGKSGAVLHMPHRRIIGHLLREAGRGIGPGRGGLGAAVVSEFFLSGSKLMGWVHVDLQHGIS